MKINKLIKHAFAVTLIAFAFFAFLTFPKLANAATYYTSTSGSDGNSGTQSSPFKTIQKGVSTVNAGDTLLVRGGTYVEQVRITRSGTVSSPITIKAYPNEQPIIDGEAGVDCLNCGLPSGTIVTDRIDPRTGRGFTWNPLVSIEGDRVTFEGFTVKRSMGRGIRVWRNNSRIFNVIVRNNQALDSRNAGMLLQNTDNILVENNVIWHSGSFAPWVEGRTSIVDWAGALSVKSGDNTVIRGNTIYENWGEGIIVDANTGGTTNTIVEDNIVFDSFSAHIYVHRSQNYTVQRNLVYNTNNPDFRRGGNPASCLVVANESQFPNSLNARNVDIVNNVVIGCRLDLTVWGSDGHGYENFLIAHNTFVNAVTNENKDAIVVNFINDDYRNFKFENNIIYQGKTTSYHKVGYVDSDISFANNLWYPRRPENGGGVGSGDIVGSDPKFADSRAYILPENWTTSPDRSWFKVKSGSPVINAGKVSSAFLSTTDIAKDMFLSSRDSSPDIGVHEYGGYTPPTTPTPTIPVGNTPTPTLPPSITPTPIPTIVPGANILSNGSFEAGLVPWLFNPSSAGSLTTSSDAIDGLTSGKVVITDDTESTQLFQTGFPLEVDTNYSFSFSAKSNTAHDLEMIVHRHSSPYTNYGLSEVFDLTTSWKSFNTEFTTQGFTGITTDTRLRVWFKPYDTVGDTYLIDNVILQKVTPDPITPTPDAIPGDANDDGMVNGADFIIWMLNYDTTTNQGPSHGDFNSDTQVNGADFVIWLMNFGK